MNKRGEGYISVCVMILVLCMLVSVLITFFTTVGIIEQTRRNARVVLDNYVMETSVEIYSSIKTGTDTTKLLDSEKVRDKLCSFCTLERKNGRLYSYDKDRKVQFYLSEPSLQFIVKDQLKLQENFVMTVPICFAGIHITDAEVPITITSRYNDKF